MLAELHRGQFRGPSGGWEFLASLALSVAGPLKPAGSTVVSAVVSTWLWLGLGFCGGNWWECTWWPPTKFPVSCRWSWWGWLGWLFEFADCKHIKEEKLIQTHNIRNKYPKVQKFKIQYFVISLQNFEQETYSMYLVYIYIYRWDYKARNTMICFGTLIKRRD